MFTRIVAAAVCLVAPVVSQTTDVLFLGNSYTNRNDLPALVEGLATAGGHTLVTDRNTPGGNTLGAPQSSGFPHRDHPTSLAKIAMGGWEVVVLQEQSVLPTIDLTRDQFMVPGAVSLRGSILASTPDARILLYQTWGRRDGGQFCWSGSCSNFPDFDSMQDALTRSYRACANAIGAEVAPVGEAWRRARQLDPTLVLHAGDGSHPNLSGSYLAACVIYARLFDQSPLGSTFYAGLDSSRATFLQTVADEVTQCQLSTFCSSLPNSFSNQGARLRATGSPRLASNDLTLHIEDGVPGSSGLFFYGSSPVAVPFGDGLRCAAGNVFRLTPPATLDAAGQLTRPLDLTTPPLHTGPGAATPGSTWHFQFWFRDPNGPSTSGFNLTDGLSATFCP